jgi:glycosyltransferase involved in cell wall biosynthesis
LKIAIMGIRGIPANYGGFETFAENLATRLVKKGHNVTVYGRSNIIDYGEKYYKGVEIKVLPTISHKYLDTVIHTFICAVASFFTKYDVVFICNSANAVFTFIPRLWGKPVVLNVDGLEWKRQKWNWLGKTFYKLGEQLAVVFPNVIVSDARDVQHYYMKKYGKSSVFIPYGAPEKREESAEILSEYNIEPNKYILYVSRMEPENNAHKVVKAFENVKTDKKLVMVGDAPYSNEYIQQLKSTTDPRIVFTGYVFGKGYRELQSNAYLYIQATEVGGTHPALLESMGYGNCVLANDVPEHREVLADTGIYFNGNGIESLVQNMQHLVDNPEKVEKVRKRIVDRVQKKYSWEAVTNDYEKLFRKVARI